MTENPAPGTPAPDEWRAPAGGPWLATVQPPSSVPPPGDWGPPRGEPVGPPAGTFGGSTPLRGSERFWVPAAHWLPLVSTWFGPLVVLLTVGEHNPRVRRHAAASLNFELTFALAMLVSGLLLFVGVGIVPLVGLPFVWVVLRVARTVRAARGEPVTYPLALPLIR